MAHPRESRTERPGRPDRYVNLDRAEREAGEGVRQAMIRAQDEIDRGTPRHAPPKPVFGQRLCPRCGGSGGSVKDRCLRCLGEGILP